MKVQHVGASPTFARIAAECQTMTYDKLNRLAYKFNLFSSLITPKILNKCFSVVTQCMKTLDFNQFKLLL
jgi:hypothetical protein